LNETEQKLLQDFRSLSPPQKRRVLTLVSDFCLDNRLLEVGGDVGRNKERTEKDTDAKDKKEQ